MDNFYPRHPCGWRRQATQSASFNHGYFYPRHPCGWRQSLSCHPCTFQHISIHATRVGGDTQLLHLCMEIYCYFYPRHPCGWRLGRNSSFAACDNFYPRHPCGWRPVLTKNSPFSNKYFYPRHPCGWRRLPGRSICYRRRFLSTPPVWVATYRLASRINDLKISIHATRVGGDCPQNGGASMTVSISIHATRVGGDGQDITAIDAIKIFLSTPPVWVATNYTNRVCSHYGISIHATRVGGDTALFVYLWFFNISIHATRVGGDARPEPERRAERIFLSTPPVWVATDRTIDVNINVQNFYPRHPCGWRLSGQVLT